tara:strand:+ start:681 stop:1460 length:780 start_codon:yes stop_codon:yes gene_type:complete
LPNLETKYQHIGILAAIPEELGSIVDNLKNIQLSKFGDMEITSGEWISKNGDKIFITTAWSGWGKVSASRATTRIIQSMYKGKKVDLIVFTGVAGAANTKLNKWDIVVSDSMMQHDMDARPIYEKFVIPALNTKTINPNKELVELIFNSLTKDIQNSEINNFRNVYRGTIATGDMFISDKKRLDALCNEIPELLAIEMEGGACAQVAYQENIDWLVVRVISDNADDDAENDFKEFLFQYKKSSWSLILCFLNALVKLYR